MPKPHQIIPQGTKFGEWTITGKAPSRFSSRGDELHYYQVTCSCGSRREVEGSTLRHGDSKSCGCKKIELMVAKITKHGMHKSKTYSVWEAMHDRCRNPNCVEFHRYGGRGITVCPEWQDFRVFLDDMGEKPLGRSLDRINNARGYTPDNCRWATPKEQMRNTRRNRIVMLHGVAMCATDAANILGVAPPNVWNWARRYKTTLQAAIDHYATIR